jgi:hypothetical protein
MRITEMFDEIAPDVSGLSVDEMIREYVRLDKRVKEAASERAAYHSALLERAAAARNGQATVHMETADEKQRIKVEFKKRSVCDQEEIECAKELLTEEKFRELFKIEYSPKSRNLKSFLNTIAGDERTETAKGIIKDAVKEVDGTPYLSIEKFG